MNTVKNLVLNTVIGFFMLVIVGGLVGGGICVVIDSVKNLLGLFM